MLRFENKRHKPISAVSLGDLSISTATDQTLTCLISGLSEDTPVTWLDSNDVVISESDANNYLVNQGKFTFGSKSSTLTIRSSKLATLKTGDIFKCRLKSPLYPENSPEVVKQTVLTILNLGNYQLQGAYILKIDETSYIILKNLNVFL
jgi:hypothetical protein